MYARLLPDPAGTRNAPHIKETTLKKTALAAAAAMLALIVTLFAPGGGDTTPAEGVTINPVVLVHGFTASPSSMATLKANFEAQGRQAFSIDYNSENNITNANQLATFINSVKAQTGAAQVDLVAHSMGGLSTRY